jgi:hypothetical protein
MTIVGTALSVWNLFYANEKLSFIVLLILLSFVALINSNQKMAYIDWSLINQYLYALIYL